MVLEDLRLISRDSPWAESFEIIVADNGSTDRTAAVALANGARVALAPRRGYGSACLAGLAAMSPATDTVIFMDGDHSDFAQDLPALLAPIQEGRADLVLGARRPVESGALTPQQRFGNALACALVRVFYRHRFADLGPFRAIRRFSLESLGMSDPAFGWTIEMQIKALRMGLRVIEVPVRYRARVGQSKISRTLLGSLRAGWAILYTIVKYVGTR